MWAFHLRLVLTGTICSVYVLNLLAVAEYCSSVFTLVTRLSRTHNLVASFRKVKDFWEMMLSKGGAQICIALYFKTDCRGILFYQLQKLISPLEAAFFSCEKSLNILKVPGPLPVLAAEKTHLSTLRDVELLCYDVNRGHATTIHYGSQAFIYTHSFSLPIGVCSDCC